MNGFPSVEPWRHPPGVKTSRSVEIPIPQIDFAVPDHVAVGCDLGWDCKYGAIADPSRTRKEYSFGHETVFSMGAQSAPQLFRTLLITHE
jgi:hypothetical protein